MEYTRFCPGCNKELKYLNKSSVISANKRNVSCKSCTHIGKTPWNKGKTGLQSHTDMWKKQASLRTSGENNPMYGKHHIAGDKNPMFGTHRTGKDNPFYRKHHSDETGKKCDWVKLNI